MLCMLNKTFSDSFHLHLKSLLVIIIIIIIIVSGKKNRVKMRKCNSITWKRRKMERAEKKQSTMSRGREAWQQLAASYYAFDGFPELIIIIIIIIEADFCK